MIGRKGPQRAVRTRRWLAAARAVTGAAILALAMTHAQAALPGAIARAFRDAGIPLTSVAIVVRESGQPQPLVSHDPERPLNPASVMKLVTTYAALDLLGPDYRWRTEAYLAGRLDASGTLAGNLVLKGYGDPKITIEQWQAFMADLKRHGLARVSGDLVLDRSYFKLPPHDAAAFDQEPLRPYNVGPDALLVNFNAVRFTFTPEPKRATVALGIDPALPGITVDAQPTLADGACGDWRSALMAQFDDARSHAVVAFPGRFAAACGEREWYVALLDTAHYVHGMFAAYFAAVGGSFDGGLAAGKAPPGASPFAVLLSPPLTEVVRDVNKLSNNVMARQIFLTLATTRHPPPATPALAAETVHAWVGAKGLRLPGLVLDNGSGLSRRARITAGGLVRLLAAAQASPVAEVFANSLAVAATDGTMRKRFQDDAVAGRAALKTGSLEGVRALAGYVTDAADRRFLVAAIVNDPHAARSGPALDYLVRWVYQEAGAYDPRLRR
ncbi:MAG: D-alanyl-D-alanine carboxypeptidase/D-alanyl-D-alanine-endopeptidase [Burkholderiales bacterium]|nr:D-alanyl-D-alanine carboxypeptidase/D-alanyl-D-alanine-endopeptidase [Burkholderiales bacterium]